MLNRNRENIKILFVDLDWTLFDHHSMRYIPSAIKALDKARKNGVKVIITTARCYMSLKFIKGLEIIPNDGYICSNGGIAFADGKYIYRKSIEPEVVKGIMKDAKKEGKLLQLIGPDYSFMSDEHNDLSKGYFSFMYEYVPLPGKYLNQEVTSIVMFSKNCEHQLLEKYPVKAYCFLPDELDISKDLYLKCDGVKALLKYYGFSKEEAFAIGDSEQDTDMFKEVTYSVAMGNASDSVKKKAMYVTSNVDKNGVQKALKHFHVI